MLEYFKARGKMTGLVTTMYVAHATPAAFGAHESSRNNYAAIASDLLTGSRPEVLFGGAKYVSYSAAIAAGYSVVTTRAQLLAVVPDAVTRISGQFGTGYLPYEYDGVWGVFPHLSDMTDVAIDILDGDADGFFLMVEGGLIDIAGHNSNLARNIYETIEFADSVQKAIDWAQGRDDTLIVVTSDHETGGLLVTANNGIGVLPTVIWTGEGNHTGVNVPVYAMGVNAEQVKPIMDNTDFFDLVSTIVPVESNFAGKGKINLVDMEVLMRNWLRNDCNNLNDWCEKTDIDRSFSVGPEDVAIFADQWLGHMTMEIRVASSNDDAEEDVASGVMSLDNSDIELIKDSSNQIVGIRFTQVSIPQGSQIANAYIQFTCDENNNVNPCNLMVYAENSDNAATFTSSNRNVSARPKTSGIAWNNPPYWTVPGLAGSDQRTPDLTSIIETVVARAGWQSGNALVFIIDGTGRRTAESYDGTYAPVLHVEFE